MEENPAIEIVYPTEGAYLFLDNWVIPKGAKNYDAAMRLFTAAGEGGKMQYAPGMDTTVDVSYNTAVSGRKINWQLSAGQYGQTGFDNRTNFMNIQVEPSATRGTAYPIEEVLQGKNMEKIDSTFYAANIKNDSIRFYSQLYATNNVSLNINGLKGKVNADTIRLRLAEQQRTAMAYSFQIKNMGWINCDRFYKYESKTDFVIHLPADVRADKFVTQIVFTSIRSVMPGQFYENKIGFMNVPVNMPVYIIGLGERNGKVVSFMQSLITGTNEVFINTLQETTPQAFRQQLQQLDL